MEFESMTLKEFTDRLGSGDAVPGGGGASALAGCLGVSLGKMVAHLTVAQARFEDSREEMEGIIAEAKALQRVLLDLITKDADMFEALTGVWRMPRRTPEEKAERDREMTKALAGACQAPLRIMESMCRALELTQAAAEHGNPSAVSDAGDAAALCRAALRSAALNVFINTKLMKDRTIAEEYNRRADCMLQEYVPKADRIYDHVLAQLRPER